MNSKELESRVQGVLAGLSEDLGLRYRIKSGARRSTASPDMLVELKGPRKERLILAIEVKASAHGAAIVQAAEQVKRAAASLNAVPVVAVPQLGGRMADWLRQQGIGYLDARGQALIRAPGVLVDRRIGDQSMGSSWARSPLSAGSPFADRSSLVLRYMLSNGLAYPGVRQLASKLKLSPGLVSRVLRRLKDEGYVREDEKGGGRLLSVDLLLQDWVDFYKRRAKRQRDRRLYMHARNVEAIIGRLSEGKPPNEFPKWALSFQAGASLVAPFAVFSEVHVLLGGPVWEESVQAISHRFALEPAGEEAN
ncbi:MAG TPA: winged helix-turn-helix transcriptional regulator, partial [Gemmatimonadales bacterium]|nr:winged helix-turn-helix transcriptional regulator [Gemmatimonadales bacterium]